jgi:hypothetical protein
MATRTCSTSSSRGWTRNSRLAEGRDERQDDGGGGTIPILPDPSENPTTMRVSQFAADLYPTALAHLEAAKALETSLKKPYTRP